MPLDNSNFAALSSATLSFGRRHSRIERGSIAATYQFISSSVPCAIREKWFLR